MGENNTPTALKGGGEKRPAGLGTSSGDTKISLLQQLYFFKYGKIYSIWEKPCQKITMGTCLRHLKQALWYLASHQ